ncbi:MBL fold metallo-hydrolase [Clostridium uliginosum]|uniref:Metallo-beta-lactamase superfamily protein n=1 Tax=Clostridium uliginosum TaxID=119641 RepID=A0A1I1JTW9_9CLOT|nr:MBL fold metallo-hydrolase [Clostridium uliginosum]SFC52097.1 Metallo-beta-lactamase superfamily protein [Clostridium uliginosum]
MLNFIGKGSAFNTDLGNTSAFIKKDNSLLLIDCGGTVFHRLQQLDILSGLESLYIVITHTHPDHVGSLGEVIFYSYYILKRKVNIFFPKKELMKSFLTSIGVSSEMYNINSFDIVYVRDRQLGQFAIEFLPVSHVDTIPSYGFIMKLNGQSFYYSGDANVISNKVIEKMKNGEINRIYQDTCGLEYENNNHLSLTKLCDIVSPEFRNNIYCMHLDKHITEQEIKDNGFNVVEIKY